MNYSKIIILPISLLILVGCSPNNLIIQEQQKQIDQLNSKLENATEQKENSDIRIERCKSEAKLYAEKNKKEYSANQVLEIMNTACKNGSTQCANEVDKFINDDIESDRQKLYEQYYSKCLTN